MCHDLAMRNRAFLTVAIAVTALAMSACSSEPEISPEEQDAKFTEALESNGFETESAQGLTKVGRLVCDNLGHGRTHQEIAVAIGAGGSGTYSATDVASIMMAAEAAYCPE